MAFQVPEYVCPNFSDEKFQNAQDVKLGKVEKDGVAPDDFYLTTYMPTYYKKDGEWILPDHNSINCVAVVDGDDVVVKEIRNLKEGDQVVLGGEDEVASGIFVNKDAFPESVYSTPGKSVETSFSYDYDKLFDLMEHERDSEDGYIVWVLGPSVVFDYDTRNALNKLAENGYINCLLAGNAMCTHDLEGGFLQTALGQNIYTQENQPMGHYNHLDLLNEVRTTGSIKEFIAGGNVKDGIIKTLSDMDIPFVLSGSIRDDGPLPEVHGDTDDALDATKEQLDKATMVICIATMLHSVSVANMTSSYIKRDDGTVSPVYLYSIDVTENVVHKVGAAREYMGFVPMVTNVQDFVVNCEKALVSPAQGVMSEDMEIPETANVEITGDQQQSKEEL